MAKKNCGHATPTHAAAPGRVTDFTLWGLLAIDQINASIFTDDELGNS